MTKKDFVKIAEAVRDARLAQRYAFAFWDDTSLAHSNRIFDGMAKTIADVLALQNPKFKRKEFLAICGVTL